MLLREGCITSLLMPMRVRKRNYCAGLMKIRFSKPSRSFKCRHASYARKTSAVQEKGARQKVADKETRERQKIAEKSRKFAVLIKLLKMIQFLYAINGC